MAWLLLGLLLSIWLCNDWHVVRFLGPFVPMLIATSFLRSTKLSRVLISSGCLAVLFASLPCLDSFIHQHQRAALNIKPETVNDCNRLSHILGAADHDITVLAPMSIYSDDGPLWLYPVTSSSNKPIRYSVAFDNQHLFDFTQSSYVLFPVQIDTSKLSQLEQCDELEKNSTFKLFRFTRTVGDHSYY